MFTLIFRSFSNPGVAIIILSVAINLLVLPLYNKADALQKEEQHKKKSLETWEKHIRKNFKSDEQFMLLSAYYRIKNYNPLGFIKEALPLLLQIPFFVAAYQFISTLVILDGSSFGPINNLIEPDKLLVTGLGTFNVLPILMTVINLFSGAIYSKGSSAKLKIQLTCTALIFLVLLYNCPSGLVLYWTISNLFSLAKSIVSHLKDTQRKTAKAIVAFIILISAEVLSLRFRIQSELAEILVICSIGYIVVILAGDKISKMTLSRYPKLDVLAKPLNRSSALILLLTELGLVTLNGLYIPSTVLSASVFEFINNTIGRFEFELITYPVCIYAGLIILWLSVFYFSLNDGWRKGLLLFLCSSLVFAVINQFAFSKSFGTLYNDLHFDEKVSFPIMYSVTNGIIGLLILIGCLYIYIKKPFVLRYIPIIITIPLLILSCRNLSIINSTLNNFIPETGSDISYDGILQLSRTENNVVVFMLDRAIGGYVPYIFDENPELAESFSGFVYYPNTVSFGRSTKLGTPGLFGGYEYTPAHMNLRDTETLEQKHNQALLVMPLIFSQAGYNTTIVDPPFAGYEIIPDMSVYESYPQINSYILNGAFSSEFVQDLGNYDYASKVRRNFVMYSAYRTAPVVLRSFVYDEGKYIYNNLTPYYSGPLIDSYSTLSRMSDLTSVSDNTRGSFLLLQNETPHNPAALTPPNYEISSSRDYASVASETDYYVNRVIDGRTLIISDTQQWHHYCINVATYEQIAVWLDYLKEQGVYDNTRIILVSDHGYNLGQFPDLITADGFDAECLCPLLMVKDFNSTGPLAVDYTFMTNADVPTLAMTGIIDCPINPFTGNPINDDDKSDGEVFVTSSYNWEVVNETGYTFDLHDGQWISVRNNIFDINNWTYVTEDEVYENSDSLYD